MNVNVVRLGPLTRAVKDLCTQVQRLADAYESELAYDKGLHMHPPKADTSGKDPDIGYTDPEMDAIREELEQQGKMTPSLQKFFGIEEEGDGQSR